MEEWELKEKVIHYNTHDYKKPVYRTRLRDQLYMSIKKEMENYVGSVLNRWGMREESGEVVSLGWDAFLFCLDRYNSKYDVYRHFFRYTEYFLLLHYSQEKERKRREDKYKEEKRKMIQCEEVLSKFPTSISLNNLSEFREFRNWLSEPYRKVFDDLVTGENSKDAYGFSWYRYYGLKKAFRLIISYLLRKNK